MRRLFKEERWFAAAFLVLCVATVTPFWVGRYLPFLDQPNHLSAIFVWSHLHDPRYNLAPYYELSLGPVPYWAYYALCRVLTPLFGVEIANKLFLSLYALLLPLGALLLARRFGKSPWVALFAFPLVWNENLFLGFISYVAGIAVLLFALVLVDRQRRRPSVAGGAAVVLVGLLLYFLHILPYVVFFVFAPLVLVMHGAPFKARRWLADWLPLLLAGLGGTLAFVFRQKLGLRGLAHEGPLRFHVAYHRFTEMLAERPRQVLNTLASPRDEIVLVVLLIAAVALLATARRDRGPRPPPEPAQRAPLALFVAALVLCFLLPQSLMQPFYWYRIGPRLAFVAVLFGALALPGPVSGRRRLLLVPVVAASLFYLGDLARTIVVLNRRFAGFDEVVRHVPYGKSTLTLVLPPLNEPELIVNCYNQWPSYTQIRRGGYNHYNFKEGFPLRYRVQKPAPPWDHAEYYNHEYMAPAWDYLLTHNDGKKVDLFGPLERDKKVRLIARSGAWALWEPLGDRRHGSKP